MRVPTPTEAASYGGSAISIGSAITLSQWGIIIGIAVCVATFLLNRADARRKRAVDAELARYAAEREARDAKYAAEKAARDAEWHAARMKSVQSGGCVE